MTGVQTCALPISLTKLVLNKELENNKTNAQLNKEYVDLLNKIEFIRAKYQKNKRSDDLKGFGYFSNNDINQLEDMYKNGVSIKENENTV